MDNTHRGLLKGGAEAGLAFSQRLHGPLALGDVLAKDGNARRFPIDQNRTEGKIERPAIGEGKFNTKLHSRERSLIERRPKHRERRRKQLTQAHPWGDRTTITSFDMFLECAVKGNQPIAGIH